MLIGPELLEDGRIRVQVGAAEDRVAAARGSAVPARERPEDEAGNLVDALSIVRCCGRHWWASVLLSAETMAFIAGRYP